MNPAVRVSQLSKVYKLYRGPRALFRELFLGQEAHHALWALRDVSFDVEPGEAFGVIGDNGAGKSTLLKILTGTTIPTCGTTNLEGRVSALLELGAGFHPEFTGRENIYFSGALLGLTRGEIHKLEPGIIAFSELEEFIDEPVKTYSSGMFLRLGFAVATEFESPILVIDEALAVGDQRFQKKCTDRILEFRRKGKTILFCSHNLYQVKTLCDRAIWLHRGVQRAVGPAGDVVQQYTDFLREASGTPSPESRPSEVCWIESVDITDGQGKPRSEFRSGETIVLEMSAHFTPKFKGTPAIGIGLVRNDGVIIYVVSSSMEGQHLKPVGGGRYTARLVFPEINLLSGTYGFNLGITDEENLQSYATQERGNSFRIISPGPDFGLVRIEHYWD